MAFADDYVSVHERIDAFLARYPEGRIQTDIARLTDTLVIMKATVYRDASDPLPTVAHSQLGIPGKTNFTRDSEVENAETSAVGRALAFMGFETMRGISSREEVNSRQAPATTPTARSGNPTATSPDVRPTQDAIDLKAFLDENGWTFADEHVRKVLGNEGTDAAAVNIALDRWYATHPAPREQQQAAIGKQIRAMRIELDKAAAPAGASMWA